MKLQIKNIDLYTDDRGFLASIWNKSDDIYLEDRISYSKYGVIRGFHGDAYTGKLCICLYGRIKFVTWDLKNKEKTERILSCPNQSIFVPPNFLLAHQCLSKECILLYKWTKIYTKPEDQWTVKYNDPTINAKWFNFPVILSDRDKNAKYLHEQTI